MHESDATNSRAERLALIRRQIADGTYDTDERLSAALDAFLDHADSGLPRGDNPAREI